MRAFLITPVFISALLTGSIASAQNGLGRVYADNLPADHPAIHYSQPEEDNSVARLSRQLADGATPWPTGSDALHSLQQILRLLDITEDSQTLVFSKTSFQSPLVSPRNPRAIYFNDSAAVGYVRGAPLLEVSAVDRKGYVQFYTFSVKTSGKPTFARQSVCLRCHQGVATQGVPGPFVGSAYPDSEGNVARIDAIITDHRTPFADRWGGWYVNAKNGEPHDRANAVAPNPVAPELLQKNLNTRFDAAGYLSGTSDIVALMTLEHQTQAVNLINRLTWLTKISSYEKKTDESSRLRINAAVEDLLSYMLFVDEPEFPQPIEGMSTFSKTFAQRGPQDRRGRSLRDFDLKTRLFRYPLSYMIYSPVFEAMPEEARRQFYQRLLGVLTGKDQRPKFSRLSSNDRKAILEIVLDTKAGLPFEWQAKRQLATMNK